MTGKIKKSLVSEFEASVTKKVQDEIDAEVNKKIQENWAWAFTKLAEANPSITINLEDFCAITSDDKNGTPVTDGANF